MFSSQTIIMWIPEATKIYYNNISPCEFFTPLLAGDFSLKSEWQQVTSALWLIIQILHSGCSQFFFWFPIPPVFFSKHFGAISSAPTTISITLTFTFLNFFLVLRQGLSICIFFTFFYFHTMIHWNGKIQLMTNSFFLLINTRSGLVMEIKWSFCISKFQRILCL